MADLSIQGEVVVNSEKAESAFDRVGDKATQMANEVAASAGKAGQAVDKIGDGAGASAEKFTRAEARMRDSIKRSTQELQLLGKTASEKLEFNIQAKGLDSAKFAPLLAQLKQVEEQSLRAQQAATGSLDKMGMSAKATAAAMRGVPAQFQDIIVSLQGGQAPMTVMLQQGSQLSGMFGGAGNAAKALGGYIMGLVNPFTLAAAAVAGLGFAMYSINGKDAALLALSAQLTGTGRASAAAVGDIKALVNELNMVPGVSKASATAIITEFAKVNGIGGDLFKGLGSAVADFAAATGTDLPTAAKKLAEAFADPAKGAQALEGALGTLTAAQILTIEKMAAMGDKSGAQVAMMDALKQATEGLAQQGMTPLGDATDKMSNAWDKLTTSIGNSEAFRTANSWLATLIEKVAELTVRLSQMKPPTWLQYLPVVGPAIGALTMAAGSGVGGRSSSGVVGEWNEGGATGSWGPTASETEQQVKAAIAATRGYETQAAAMEKLRGVATQAKAALKELEGQNRGGSVEAVRLRDSIAAVNEKLADMGKKGGPKGPAKETISEYDKLIKKLSDELPRAAAEAEAAQMGYNKAQTEFLALAGSDVWAKFSSSERARVAAVYEGKIASEQAADAAKELSKAYAEAAAERIKTIQSMERAADGLQSQNDALREEIELIGLSTEQQTVVLQQRNDVIILTKEATLAELERQSAITGTQARVEIALAAEIEALKERNALLGAKGVKNAAVDAAKTAADEWKKTADSINNTLTDALMRGFESGKDFAKNLRDTVINMFKTMVLRPVISAIVNPIAGAVTGMMGLSGAANAASGASGGASMLGNVGSLIGAGSSAFGVGASYGATSLFANGLGSTLSAGSSMIGAGSTMSGLGTMAGALGPIALGIGALFTLIKKFDDSGTPHTGAGATYSAAGGLQDGAGIYNKAYLGMGSPDEYSAAMQKGVSSVAQGIATALDSTAKNFGKTAGYEITTAFADDSSKDGAWGALKIKLDGKSVLDWADTAARDGVPKEFASGEDGAKQYAAALGEGLRTALNSIGLPAWAQSMLDGVGEGATVEQLAGTIDQINGIKSALVSMGKNLTGFADLTDGAVSALLRASGGIDALAANAGSYYENFYSEGERTANTTRAVAESLSALGLAMPTTRDGFRALVEQQQALGESGMGAVAALLGVSGAFASVVPAVDTAKTASEKHAAALDAQKTASERASAAAQNLTSTYDALQSALQAVVDYGAAIEGNISDTSAAINSLRLQAASGLAGAQAAFVQAAAAIRNERDRTAAQVGSATDGVARAQAALVSAIGAVANVLQQQADAVTSAQGRVDNALTGITQAYLSAVQGLEGADARVKQAQSGLTDAYLSAQGKYESAQQALADLQSRSADSLRGTADNIRDFLDRLSGTELGGSSAGQTLAYNRALFADVAQRAQAGDAASAARLTGLADQLLTSSKAGSTSFEQYQGDVLQVRTLLAKVAGAPGASAQTKEAVDPMAQALQAVADAQAEMERARAAAQSAGAPLVQAQADLLAEYRAAVADQVQAQAAMAQATAAVNASGASTAAAQADLLAEWGAAIGDMTAAQSIYDQMLAGVAASGVDLTLQASADALGSALAGVTSAQTGLSSAHADLTAAQTAAAAATTAWTDAQAMAVELATGIPDALSGLPAMQSSLASSAAALADAQALFVAVRGDLASSESGTAAQYGALQTQLAGYVTDLESYRARVGEIDFADLVNTDELGVLLADLNGAQTGYTAALAESAAAVMGLASASSAVSAILLAAQPNPQATAQSASLRYLSDYTDVGAAYAANSYGMGIDQFAAYHFQNYGMAEGRTSAFTQADLQRLLIDGSHASGLDYVPFDGYFAELHTGEGVLTADENRVWHALDFSRFSAPSSDALVSEIRALRQQVANMGAEIVRLRSDNSTENRSIKLELADQGKLMRRQDVEGLPPTRVTT